MKNILFPFLFVGLVLNYYFLIRLPMIQEPAQPEVKLVNPAPTIKPEVLSTSSLERLVNNYRITQNLKPIKHDERLCNFALTRSQEAFTDWSHDGFYESAYAVENQTGYRTLGENLARDWDTEEQTIQAWVESPTHKQNILINWQGMCLVCTNNVCANIFGK